MVTTTAERSTEIWRITEAQRKSLQSIGESIIKDALDKQFLEVIRRMVEQQSLSVSVIVKEEPLRAAYLRLYVLAGGKFARTSFDEIMGSDVKNDLDEIWRQFMESFVKTRVGGRITQVTETIRVKIQKIVTDVLRENLSIPDAIREMRKQWTGVSTARASAIARTEIISASNIGSLAGARSLGLPMTKEWIATRDSRVRDRHAFADGQTKPLDQDFFVGGERLSMPGDPKGSPGNTINCRCAIGFKVIR